MHAAILDRMPRIIVTADDSSGRVLHSERVTPSDFETEHFRTQLAERVAWAVEDAELATGAEPRQTPAAAGEAATHAPAHAA
jgi:hypothetical protein